MFGNRQESLVVHLRVMADPDGYWKAGDLWPRSRGLLDRNAPGCPYHSC
jgi:hypothetical protein